MTGPINRGHYQRCFPNPWNRPSSMVSAGWAEAATVQRVRELGQWLDEQDQAAVVQGAEALLAAEGRRFQARGESRGEPGA